MSECFDLNRDGPEFFIEYEEVYLRHVLRKGRFYVSSPVQFGTG